MSDESRKSKGFGFVSFENFEDTQKAAKGINGKVLNRSQIYYGRAHNKVERQFGLKYKHEQIKQHKFTRCKNAKLYKKKINDK